MKTAVDVVGFVLLMLCGLAVLLGMVLVVLWEVRQVVRMSTSIVTEPPADPSRAPSFSWEADAANPAMGDPRHPAGL